MALDPGAFGTLVNGLRAIEAEQRAYDAAAQAEVQPMAGHGPTNTTQPSRRPLRAALARAMRGAADRLEPAR